MPKTLVTGAAGFIGSAVVRKLLGRGREVRAMLRPGESAKTLEGLDVELVTADVNDRDGVGRALAGCDALYHLAAIYALWLPEPARMYEVNVEGSKTVLFAAWKAGLRRVVYTSSIAAVGQRDDGEPADETVAFNRWEQSNGYIRSKWLSERDALRFAREGLPLVVVNPAFPFGERDVGPTPTGDFIVQALRKRIPFYLDGGFCAVDVDDVAEAHVRAEEVGRVGERYILGNHNVWYRDFFARVAEIAGVPAPRRRIPPWLAMGVGAVAEEISTRYTHKKPYGTYKAARYASSKLWFDTTKARTELGLPGTSLDETIEKSVRWFRANGYA